MAEPRSRQTVTPYSWGSGGQGWRLCDRQEMQVVEEVLAAGTAEERHYHRNATQVYYILSGCLRVEMDDETHQLSSGEAVEITPGTRHLIANDTGVPASLLVISSPSTRNDRVKAEPDQGG